jgi:hypothetical protein
VSFLQTDFRNARAQFWDVLLVSGILPFSGFGKWIWTSINVFQWISEGGVTEIAVILSTVSNRAEKDED